MSSPEKSGEFSQMMADIYNELFLAISAEFGDQAKEVSFSDENGKLCFTARFQSDGAIYVEDLLNKRGFRLSDENGLPEVFPLDGKGAENPEKEYIAFFHLQETIDRMTKMMMKKI